MQNEKLAELNKLNNYEDDLVKGLYYIPDYLTVQEQQEIMKYLRKTKKWQTVGKSYSSRRVIQFGYSYSYDRTGVKKIEELPEYFQKLVDIEHVNGVLNKELLTEDMEQLIINEYKPGQGIHPHIDHYKYFGPIIVCLTIGSGIGIDFTRVDDPSIGKQVYVKPGSLYIMSGESRSIWRHGIKRGKYDGPIKRGIRYSLTYRTILENKK